MLASGSTFPEIIKLDVRSLTIVMSAKEIMDNYKKVAEPNYKSSESNQKEIQTLAQLRDSLLPRLMSRWLRLG